MYLEPLVYRAQVRLYEALTEGFFLPSVMGMAVSASHAPVSSHQPSLSLAPESGLGQCPVPSFRAYQESGQHPRPDKGDQA